MTTVYLIRHAEAEGNLYRRAHGHTDATITERGYRQIAALSRRFEDVPVDAAYASDLCRTQTTALAITLSRHLLLHTTPNLREICVGEWEDKTWAEIGRYDRENLVRFNTDIETWSVPGGQSAVSVRARMQKALSEIIAAHPDQTVAVFSHGMALRILVGTLRGLTLHEIDETGHAENTAVTKLEADENGVRVLYSNDASHLTDELSTLQRQAWTRNKGGLEAGIYFRPSGEAGHFDVWREEEIIGAVSVGTCENGIAEIGEYWLDNAAQGKGTGIQLLGQAVSYARAQACDTLRVALPRSNAPGLRRAREYGFSPVRESAQSVVFEQYFGYSEEYRVKKLQDAIKNDEK